MEVVGEIGGIGERVGLGIVGEVGERGGSDVGDGFRSIIAK